MFNFLFILATALAGVTALALLDHSLTVISAQRAMRQRAEQQQFGTLLKAARKRLR